MYVYVCICVNVYVRVYKQHMCIYMCVCMLMHVCMSVFVGVCVVYCAGLVSLWRTTLSIAAKYYNIVNTCVHVCGTYVFTKCLCVWFHVQHACFFHEILKAGSAKCSFCPFRSSSFNKTLLPWTFEFYQHKQ